LPPHVPPVPPGCGFVPPELLLLLLHDAANATTPAARTVAKKAEMV
jgi:hypothetical protein